MTCPAAHANCHESVWCVVGAWSLLQCVFPLAFVCISFAFRSLQNLDLAAPTQTVTFNGAQFDRGGHVSSLPYLVSGTALNVSALGMHGVDGVDDVPPAWVSALLGAFATSDTWAPLTPLRLNESSLQGVEQTLLDGKYSGGALLATPVAVAGLNFSVTIVVNNSFTHSAPTLMAMFDSAILRHVEGNSTASFQPRSHPFPRAGASVSALGTRQPVLAARPSCVCTCANECVTGALPTALALCRL
jgi:hypothetical protein